MDIERMARILVLGGAGALGHKMFQLLRQKFPDTHCTIRGKISDPTLRHIELFQAGNVIEQIDASDFARLAALLDSLRPEFVVNCIGVIKQRPATHDIITSLTLNSLLPHKLAELCQRTGSKLIHFSTDCVFSGSRGSYREDDVSDATDIYGRTKYLGETREESALTLRTSFIGRELAHHVSLLDWFLSQNHQQVNGYTNAIYTGLTSIELVRVVSLIIGQHRELSGLYQVTSKAISKFELLGLLRDAYKLDIRIQADTGFRCNRSMVGEKFQQATGYCSPSWPELVAQVANDTTPYERWKESER
jgi:dTDP-4-dehydrorhamnose reductase